MRAKPSGATATQQQLNSNSSSNSRLPNSPLLKEHPSSTDLWIQFHQTHITCRSLTASDSRRMAHGRAQYGTDLLSTSQDMMTALDRSAMALNMIAHTLENEFSERFGHTGANPLEVAKRLRKLQRDLPALKQECQAVLQCKQDLVDSARRLLDANSSQLQQLCSKSGFTPPDDQGVHDAYNTAVKEWEGQMLQRYAGMPEGMEQKYSSHSLNQALASTRLQ